MKINLDELRKAVTWIQANSRDIQVKVYLEDGNKLVLGCMDKNDSEVDITLFTDSQMLPKIKKTDILR